jgi:hypothetical protein
VQEKRLDRSRRNLVSLLRAALDLSFPIITVVVVAISSHILQSSPIVVFQVALPLIDIRQQCGGLSVCIWIGLLYLDSFPCTSCTSGTVKKKQQITGSAGRQLAEIADNALPRGASTNEHRCWLQLRRVIATRDLTEPFPQPLRHNCQKPCRQIHDARQSQCSDSDTAELAAGTCDHAPLVAAASPPRRILDSRWQLRRGPPPGSGAGRWCCRRQWDSPLFLQADDGEFSDGGAAGTGRSARTAQLSVLLQEQRTTASCCCKSCLFLGSVRHSSVKRQVFTDRRMFFY